VTDQPPVAQPPIWRARLQYL